MTDEQADKIALAIDRMTITVSASILMRGWVPDQWDGNKRVAKAIHGARSLLNDSGSQESIEAFLREGKG